MSLLLAIVADVGTLATTNANDTLAASGTPVNVGTVARTNNNDTATASGAVLPSAETGGGTVTHAGNYQPSPSRPKPEPPKPVPPKPRPIIGQLATVNTDDNMIAAGAVDPHRLMIEDEELLLLTG